MPLASRIKHELPQTKIDNPRVSYGNARRTDRARAATQIQRSMRAWQSAITQQRATEATPDAAIAAAKPARHPINDRLRALSVKPTREEPITDADVEHDLDPATAPSPTTSIPTKASAALVRESPKRRSL